MQAFTYERAATLAAALTPGATVIAGGTELLNWMKEGIAAPRRLLDISRLPGLDAIETDAAGLRIGALARLERIARQAAVQQGYPALAQALLHSASPQIRSMATLGGNLMQRTRCPYFRAEVELPCNKRRPGSGCAALLGEDRQAALFGWSEQCLATHPSDAAVALAALDATVEVTGPAGRRALPLTDFHRLPGETPIEETALRPGELITAVMLPASPLAARSLYLKLRERASYEFALLSVAAALRLEGGVIREARLALGGVAARPWRLFQAEAALVGLSPADLPALRAALAADLAEARPRRQNGFKVELARRALLRALQTLGGEA